MDITRKVALVTGGSRGIGAAIVEKFARKGYNVCFSYEKNQLLADSLVNKCRIQYGVDVIGVKADNRKADDIVALVQACIVRFGQIDALVNNAGIALSKVLIDYSPEDIADILDVNLKAAILTTKEAVNYMTANDNGGKIVNISSMWGVSGAAMESVYSASKAGLIGFTKAMAKELGLMRINVNAVAPGCVNTDMLKGYTEEELEALKQNTALGRIGTPEEIANVVFFLCSNLSSFITGEVIKVDGGFLQ